MSKCCIVPLQYNILCGDMSDFLNICFSNDRPTILSNIEDIQYDNECHLHVFDDISELADMTHGDLIIFFTEDTLHNILYKQLLTSIQHPIDILIVVNDLYYYYHKSNNKTPTSIERYTQRQLNHFIDLIVNQKEEYYKLERLAYFDQLTHLSNRKALKDQFEYISQQKNQYALFLIDCDNFKIINDGNGHLIGDEYLIQIASRLQHIGNKHRGIASRYGGDEFVLLIPYISNDRLESIANEMLQLINEPINCSTISFEHVGCSVGISVLPIQCQSLEGVLQQADTAMYIVKERGGNNFQIFNDELSLKHERRKQIIQHISQAHTKEEFSLRLQPIYDSSTKISGAEVLLRWNDSSTNTNITPTEFVPLLEQTGEIVKIGFWIIEQTIISLKTLQLRDIVADDFWVSINISPKQLTYELVSFIEEKTNIHGIDPSLIHLEITERVFLEPNTFTKSVLHKLRELGCKILLDDFGTGYCSFAYIKQWNIDGVKIDKSFILQLKPNTIDFVITKAIIEIGHFLNISIIAEGIEHEHIKQQCIELGCTHLQGIHLSNPLTLSSFESLL